MRARGALILPGFASFVASLVYPKRPPGQPSRHAAVIRASVQEHPEDGRGETMDRGIQDIPEALTMTVASESAPNSVLQPNAFS